MYYGQLLCNARQRLATRIRPSYITFLAAISSARGTVQLQFQRLRVLGCASWWAAIRNILRGAHLAPASCQPSSTTLASSRRLDRAALSSSGLVRPGLNFTWRAPSREKSSLSDKPHAGAYKLPQHPTSDWPRYPKIAAQPKPCTSLPCRLPPNAVVLRVYGSRAPALTTRGQSYIHSTPSHLRPSRSASFQASASAPRLHSQNMSIHPRYAPP